MDETLVKIVPHKVHLKPTDVWDVQVALLLEPTITVEAFNFNQAYDLWELWSKHERLSQCFLRCNGVVVEKTIGKWWLL